MAGGQPLPRTTATKVLERLGRPSLRELSMDGPLQTVADLAKTVMPGAPRRR